MTKLTLPSDPPSRRRRARGSGRDVQDFKQVKRHLDKRNVYLETIMSDPYGRFWAYLRVQRVPLLAPNVSSR